MSWSTSELRVRLAPLNRFKPSSKIFYWPFQGGTSFYGSFMFLFCLVFAMSVRVCLYVLCGHLLGKGWPLGSRLWCLLWVCHFLIGILGQVWYLIVSIPDLCTFTYFHLSVFAQYLKNKYIENKLELECTVDGVPSQIPTLKFLIHPAPPSPTPGSWPQQQIQNSVQYVFNIYL